MEFILCSPQMFLPFLHEERQVVGRACEGALGHVGLFQASSPSTKQTRI